MFLVQQITTDPRQQMTLVLPDGSSLTMTIYFVPMQNGWFITNLTYKTFILNGFRVVVSPNMLNQYRNKIPFGLACYSVDNREPSLQEDFSSFACNLYILSEAECNQYAELLSLSTP